MPVIYLDVLVVLNWFIDFLLLSSTSRILRLPFKRWRLVLGALLGGISSCLIFCRPCRFTCPCWSSWRRAA